MSRNQICFKKTKLSFFDNLKNTVLFLCYLFIGFPSLLFIIYICIWNFKTINYYTGKFILKINVYFFFVMFCRKNTRTNDL